jgi:hypothetical protein
LSERIVRCMSLAPDRWRGLSRPDETCRKPEPLTEGEGVSPAPVRVPRAVGGPARVFPAGALPHPNGLGALCGPLAHPILRLRCGPLPACRVRVATTSNTTCQNPAAARSQDEMPGHVIFLGAQQGRQIFDCRQVGLDFTGPPLTAASQFSGRRGHDRANATTGSSRNQP